MFHALQSASLDPRKVLQLLETAVTDKAILTFTFPGNKKQYRTRLLNLDTHSQEMALVVAPLEPSDGNIKIRANYGDKAIAVKFVAADRSYQGDITFLNVSLINNLQVLRLSFPKQLKQVEKVRKREEKRLAIPAHIKLAGAVTSKGQDKVLATIEDLSTGGLSFSCPTLSTPIKEGSVVGVVITGGLLKGESITLSGIIRRHVVLRNGTQTNMRSDHYGLQFRPLSPSTSAALDRLIRLRIPSPEDSYFITEQVRYSV